MVLVVSRGADRNDRIRRKLQHDREIILTDLDVVGDGQTPNRSRLESTRLLRIKASDLGFGILQEILQFV